jgi:hypothetical protein
MASDAGGSPVSSISLTAGPFAGRLSTAHELQPQPPQQQQVLLQQQQPQQQQSTSSSSSDTRPHSGKQQLLKDLIGSVALLHFNTIVGEWEDNVKCTLQSPEVQQLQADTGTSDREIALLLRSRISQDKVMSAVTAKIPAENTASIGVLIAYLHRVLRSNDKGLARSIGQIQQKPGQATEDLANSIYKLHEKHRVRLPDRLQQYIPFIARFNDAAQQYINVTTNSVGSEQQFSWPEFVEVCREYDASNQQSNQQPQQQQQQLPPPPPPQQQQQPANRASPQQQGGRQVRFQPSANGTGYEGEHYNSPPPPTQVTGFPGWPWVPPLQRQPQQRRPG